MQFRSYFTSKTYQQNQMKNPQSAKERFKNHLAYQLGLCALYFYQGQDCTLSAKNEGGGGKITEV